MEGTILSFDIDGIIIGKWLGCIAVHCTVKTPADQCFLQLHRHRLPDSSPV